MVSKKASEKEPHLEDWKESDLAMQLEFEMAAGLDQPREPM